MNGRVMVLCASRDRNFSVQRMIDSVNRTSTHADVAVYVDEDQANYYGEVQGLNVGPQIGPVASLNELWRLHPGYDAYGAATDDCEFLTPGWDQWVLGVSKEFRAGIGVMAPWVHGTTTVFEGAIETARIHRARMDFPWATGRWIETVGWFAYPGSGHFYWDVVSEVIGWQTGIKYATEDEFKIDHDSVPTKDVYNKVLRDAVRCIQGIAFDVQIVVDRLKAAQA